MPHDWIFDVLNDMRVYAVKNGLPALATQLDEALKVAKAEIKAPGQPEEPPPDDTDD